MNEAFRQHVEALHPKFELLMGLEAHSFRNLPAVTNVSGIYLLSEADQHLYIGRAKAVRSRLRMHIGNDPAGASFAVKLTREIMKRPATYKKDNSLKALRAESAFTKAFAEANKRIRQMDIRFVEEPDCNRQALLEIYACIVLNTRYNDFETH